MPVAKYRLEVIDRLEFLKYGINTSTLMVRRNVFKKTGLFLPSLRIKQDVDLYIRILRYYEIKVALAPMVIIGQHKGQYSHNVSPEEVRRAVITIIQRMSLIFPNENPEEMKKILDKKALERLGYLHLTCGKLLLSQFCKELYTYAQEEFNLAIQYLKGSKEAKELLKIVGIKD